MLPQIIQFGQLPLFYLQVSAEDIMNFIYFSSSSRRLCVKPPDHISPLARLECIHMSPKWFRYLYSFICFVYLVLLKEVFLCSIFCFKILPVVDTRMRFSIFFFCQKYAFLVMHVKVFFRFCEAVSERYSVEKQFWKCLQVCKIHRKQLWYRHF